MIMHMKVSSDQFRLDGDKLTHLPTGATFWLGQRDVVCCEAGIQPGNGNDYDLGELKEQAWQIMKTERNACI
jgi:hypothetical protein